MNHKKKILSYFGIYVVILIKYCLKNMYFFYHLILFQIKFKDYFLCIIIFSTISRIKKFAYHFSSEFSIKYSSQ